MLDMSPEARRADALLKAPRDRWVALSVDETSVVAVGETFEEAATLAAERGESDPLIVKTPAVWSPLTLHN